MKKMYSSTETKDFNPTCEFPDIRNSQETGYKQMSNFEKNYFRTRFVFASDLLEAISTSVQDEINYDNRIFLDNEM